MLKQQLNNKSNSVAVSSRRHKQKNDSPKELSLNLDISLVHDSVRQSKFKNNQRYNNNSQFSEITTMNPETLNDIQSENIQAIARRSIQTSILTAAKGETGLPNKYIHNNEGYRQWLRDSNRAFTSKQSPRERFVNQSISPDFNNRISTAIPRKIPTAKSTTIDNIPMFPTGNPNPLRKSSLGLRKILEHQNGRIDQDSCKCPPNINLRKSAEISQNPQNKFWDDQFYSKFKKFFIKSEQEMVQQQQQQALDRNPQLVRMQQQAKMKQPINRTPINLDQFNDDSFNHMMENLEKRHQNVGLGKDLGARMKLLTDQFNTKLGEISDYMFSVVGKEVNRNLDQISENITKIQSDSKTYKMLC